MARGAVVASACLLVAVGCASGGVRAQSTPRTSASGGGEAQGESTPARASALQVGVHRYEYVFPDGSMYVYDMDAGQRLVERVELPDSGGVRGVAVSPSTHTLYVSYGGDGDGNGTGSLLAYDLLAKRVLWQRSYPTGIDSMAISPDGSRIYMPTGELDQSGVWKVLNAADGTVIGSIQGGAGAHNTVIGPSGRNVYLGGRNYDYLEVASTATDRVFRRIGPLRDGVRPFTIDGRETLAYTTATGFLGFQVSSIATGRVLYTQTFPGFGWNPATFPASAPSHGISLSPDGRRLWVIDGPNSYVHVFDVAGVPGRRPKLLANIRLVHPLAGQKSPCAYDCTRDGWLQNSLDGRFVYVGDSGDVLSTSTDRVVGYLPAMNDSREMIEIDWRGGAPIATSTRTGLGYAR